MGLVLFLLAFRHMHCNGVLIFYRAAAKGACCGYIQRVFITTGDRKG